MILDSAVAYVMDKVDFVLVGSEAVVESGGLVNAVGSNQIAIIARAAHKPFYALAERYFYLLLIIKIKKISIFYYSYKFHRLFPLSQYDLPSHNSKILAFPRPYLSKPPQSLDTSTESSSTSVDNQSDLIPPRITQDQISQNNPDVDYTRLVICLVAAVYRFRHIIVLLDPISFRLYFRMWAV